MYGAYAFNWCIHQFTCIHDLEWMHAVLNVTDHRGINKLRKFEPNNRWLHFAETLYSSRILLISAICTSVYASDGRNTSRHLREDYRRKRAAFRPCLIQNNLDSRLISANQCPESAAHLLRTCVYLRIIMYRVELLGWALGALTLLLESHKEIIFRMSATCLSSWSCSFCESPARSARPRALVTARVQSRVDLFSESAPFHGWLTAGDSVTVKTARRVCITQVVVTWT